MGERVEEQGRLIRGTAGFVLRCDHGGALGLLLARTPVDLFEKMVRIRGTLIEPAVLEVELIQRAG